MSSRPSSTRRWRQVRSNPKIAMGAAILLFFGLVIAANPLLWATVWEGQERLYDPVIGYDHMIVHPSAPSVTHWLGTDSLGRDVTSMFTLAAQSSVAVAVAAALASGAVSLVLGSLAAYHRRWVDAVVTHMSDAMVLLPALLAVWIVGVGRPDETFGAVQVGAVFGLVYGLGPATAAVRAAGLVVMAKPFVEAARLVQYPDQIGDEAFSRLRGITPVEQGTRGRSEMDMTVLHTGARNLLAKRGRDGIDE